MPNDTSTTIPFSRIPHGRFFKQISGRVFYKAPREHFFAETETSRESVVIWQDEKGCLKMGTMFDTEAVLCIL